LKNRKFRVILIKLKYVKMHSYNYFEVKSVQMRGSKPFNKRVFALLIDKARGERTTKQFANDCGISYVQLHKLELCGQENAPGLKLLTKLAANSAGGIELEDYMLAAGYTEEKKKSATVTKKRKSVNIQDMFENLTSSQQKTVYDFMDYLANYKK